MPSTAGNGLNGPSPSQLEAREMLARMFHWMKTIDTAMRVQGEKRALGFCTVAMALVLAVRSERDGRPATLEDVGARATTWRHEATIKGVGLGLMRATAWGIRFARMMALQGKREHHRHLTMLIEDFEHGGKVERFEQADRASRKRKMEAEVESYFRKTRCRSA